MKISNVSFSDESKLEILSLFGKNVDDEGYIVEKGNQTQRVLTQKGEEIRFEEWAGVIKGSEAFLKNDTFSLIELAKRLE